MKAVMNVDCCPPSTMSNLCDTGPPSSRTAQRITEMKTVPLLLLVLPQTVPEGESEMTATRKVRVESGLVWACLFRQSGQCRAHQKEMTSNDKATCTASKSSCELLCPMSMLGHLASGKLTELQKPIKSCRDCIEEVAVY